MCECDCITDRIKANMETLWALIHNGHILAVKATYEEICQSVDLLISKDSHNHTFLLADIKNSIIVEFPILHSYCVLDLDNEYIDTVP